MRKEDHSHVEEKLRQAKALHEQVTVPDELAARVQRALARGKPRRYVWLRAAATGMAAVLCLFTLLLNTSEVFAASMADLPVIGPIAQVFTFREYAQKDDASDIHVRIPAIGGTGNTALEKRINNAVQEKIDALVAEARAEALEYKAMMDEAGYEACPVEIRADYNIYYASERVLTFRLVFYRAYINYHEQVFFYNIDLATGEDITLADMLGPNYRAICNEAVYAQMRQRMQAGTADFFPWEKSDPNYMEGIGFEGIGDSQPFYIDEAGNVVLYFEKYSIAPGSSGAQEFVIPASKEARQRYNLP
nr:RsiV family protein [Maliibacterium massiliense]